MSQEAIRFKDATIQLTFNGRKLLGTFTKISSFTITPDKEVKKSMYAGEKRQRIDLDVKGYDFTIELNEAGKEWQTVAKAFEDADRNGTPFPRVTITVTGTYRAAGAARTGTAVLHDEVIMFFDNRSFSGSEYVKIPFSGSCREMRLS